MDFNFDNIKGWLGGLLVLVFGAGAGKALIVNWFQKSTELASAKADTHALERQERRVKDLEEANYDLIQKLLDAAKIEGEQRGKILALEGKIEQHERTITFLSEENARLRLSLDELREDFYEFKAMVGRRKEDVQIKQ